VLVSFRPKRKPRISRDEVEGVQMKAEDRRKGKLAAESACPGFPLVTCTKIRLALWKHGVDSYVHSKHIRERKITNGLYKRLCDPSAAVLQLLI
jgi:hypothetical protein